MIKSIRNFWNRPKKYAITKTRHVSYDEWEAHEYTMRSRIFGFGVLSYVQETMSNVSAEESEARLRRKLKLPKGIEIIRIVEI